MTDNDPFSGAEFLKDFKCLCCGNCCRGDGFVRVTAEDIDRMAAALRIHREHFIAKYTRQPELAWHRKRGDLWLTNHEDKPLDCIFLVNNKCVLHDAKPDQCREFPYLWRHVEMLAECAGYQALKEKMAAVDVRELSHPTIEKHTEK